MKHRHISCIFYQGFYFYFHSIQKLLVLLGNNDNGWKMAAHGASLPWQQITRQQVTFLWKNTYKTNKEIIEGIFCRSAWLCVFVLVCVFVWVCLRVWGNRLIRMWTLSFVFPPHSLFKGSNKSLLNGTNQTILRLLPPSKLLLDLFNHMMLYRKREPSFSPWPLLFSVRCPCKRNGIE